MTHVNLDHQAGSALDSKVLEAMQPFLTFNHHPASLHHRGIHVRKALDSARSEVADLIGAPSPDEVIFTNSANEAMHLAIKGYCHSHPDRKQIILSEIEPTAIMRCVEWMEGLGFQPVLLSVDSSGLVNPSDLKAAITSKTALVCIHWVNPDIGTIQRMKDLAQVCAETETPFYTDASSAVGHLPVDLSKIPITMLSVGSEQFGGPQGVGALYVQRGVTLVPPNLSGNQDRELRARSEYIAGIVGMGTAATIARQSMEHRIANTRQVQLEIIKFVSTQMEDVHLLGPSLGSDRAGYHLSLAASGAEGEALALKLDLQGFAVASRPACLLKSDRHSHVLLAIGIPQKLGESQVLLTLGSDYPDGEITRFCQAYKKCVTQLHAMN